MKGITLCADCAYYNMKKHKCTRGCKIDPDVSKGENPSFYVDCPLPDVEPVQKWIHCSERLPEDQTRVLIKTIYGSMCIAKRCGNGDWYTDGSGTYHAHEVASWMPLPEEGGEQ
jgi:hypothetical protein